MKSTRRHFLLAMPAAAATAVLAPYGSISAAARTLLRQVINVRHFGARGDGVALDTSALQKAIEACARQGGGTVYLPPGRYRTGTLRLKSWITLELETGATLLGSHDLAHYPPIIPSIRSFTDTYTERSLIYGEDLQGVTLQGRGVIDGQGAAFGGNGDYKVRPYLIRFVGCRNVLVRDLTLKDSPMWVQHYLACDDLRLDGLTVVSTCNANNDGMDIDACQRVRITNCNIQSGDDAIVLKSTLNRPCRHVVITNCVLSSLCNAFKLGTESNGGFADIALSNCAIYDTALAGIALETVDGGVLERVTASNITMDNVRCPLFIRLGNRARPFQTGALAPGMGRLSDVRISGIVATGAGSIGCSIVGLPGFPVENVELSGLRLSFAGGGKESDAQRQIPEKPHAYPEYSMFGILPAYGLYCRHAHNLTLRDIEVGWREADARPSLLCDDVTLLRVLAWNPLSAAGPQPVIRLEDVRQALLQGCRAPDKPGACLRIGGKDTARIKLLANDFGKSGKIIETDPDLPPGAVTIGDSGP